METASRKGESGCMTGFHGAKLQRFENTQLRRDNTIVARSCQGNPKVEGTMADSRLCVPGFGRFSIVCPGGLCVPVKVYNSIRESTPRGVLD
jgi:hypothetical protein